MRISLSGVTGDSIVDGPGLRLTIFTQGLKSTSPGASAVAPAATTHRRTTPKAAPGRIQRISLRRRQKIPYWTGLPFRAATPFYSLSPALPWRRVRIKSA